MLQVHRRRLDNGLTVIVLHLPHLHSVAMSCSVRSGPRFEGPNENGLSHLLEHLVFRGTGPHPDSFALNSAVEALGGDINGLTQRDAMAVHLTVPPDHAARGLTLLGEICTQPLLTGIQIERSVVIEEILDTTDSQGAETDLDTLARQVLWAPHPMSRPVAGTQDDVEGFSEAQCRAHYDRTVVGGNGVVVVAGAVDPAGILDVAASAFSKMPSGPALLDPPAPKTLLGAPIHVQHTDDSQVTVMLSFEVPHENQPDFAAVLLLRRILDDGLSSRLRQALCEQTGLAYSVAASVDAYADIAALDVEVSCSPRKVPSAIFALSRALESLSAGGVTEAELSRAKVRQLAEGKFGLDDPADLASWYAATELIGCASSYEDRLTEASQVTREQLTELVRRCLRIQDALPTLLGPVDDDMLTEAELLLGRPKDSSLAMSEFEEDETDDDPPLELLAG